MQLWWGATGTEDMEEEASSRNLLIMQCSEWVCKKDRLRQVSRRHEQEDHDKITGGVYPRAQ